MSWQHLPFEPKDRQPIETHYHYHHHYSRVIDPEDDDFNWKTNDYLSPKVVKMPNQEFFVRELETDSRGRRK